MKKNMGIADIIVRVLIAATIIALYFANVISGTFGIILLALAAIFMLTSFLSFCPLYTLFNINTCKRRN